MIGSQRRLIVPEVIQTSAMDCGPAALKCLLEGFYISASYGRLREACQTAVDGTSVEMVETVARQLGLDAEQVMLPKDDLWLPQANALPAMVVAQHPNGTNHFVIVWQRYGRWLQIMDPGVGRRWTRCEKFAREIYPHRTLVAPADWFEWAQSGEARGMFAARMHALGAENSTAEAMITHAGGDWHALAALDAAVRMVSTLLGAGALRRGEQALRLLRGLLARTAQEAPGVCAVIPREYWSVLPNKSGEQLILRGAVLLRIRGRLPAPSCETEHELPPELHAALTERTRHPVREMWDLLRTDGLLAPLALLGALGLAVGALIIEALLFRGLFDLARDLNLVSQRMGALAAVLIFVVLLCAFEFPITAESLRLGRKLETRLRLLLLRKLPALSERYFQSRPISDMAERSHSIYLLRQLPDLAARLVKSVWELFFTLLGIALIDAHSLPLALVIATAAIGVIAAAQPALGERDLRMRSHAGALHVFYLDALLGIVPIRTHAAERAVRREHEALLCEWARASKTFLRLSLTTKAGQSLVCLALAGVLLWRHIDVVGITGNLLLLVYWVLKLPALGESLAALAAQYPTQRNVALRLLEPLKAPEASTAMTGALEPPRVEPVSKAGPRLVKRPAAVSIEMRSVEVVAAGNVILRDVKLNIRAGEHVAIVGPSGAGKSSVLGLLLGWHQPAAGTLLIDHEPLQGQSLQRLRAETAWVDPAIQLWNRSLLDNLRYPSSAGSPAALGQVLENADLAEVLVRLPQGLQTSLSEGGVSLSGGEGQRVRVGRALWQQGVRLALLDEPFRGLDREQRRRHLAEARRTWQDATLLCVTHDVAETRSFERVLVVENGGIVEDAHPEDLAATASSRYRNLLDIEESLRHGLWNAALWRRIRLESGRVQDANRVILKSAVGHE